MEREPGKETKKNCPWMVKAASLFLVVLGVISFFYFSGAFVYAVVHPAFLTDLKYEKFLGSSLLLPVFIEILFSLGFFLSGFWIFRCKKIGRILFYFVFLVWLVFSYIFLNSVNAMVLAIGFIILIINVIYKNRFTETGVKMETAEKRITD